MSQYESWILNFAEEAIAPTDNTTESLFKFIEQYRHHFQGFSPVRDQPLRYCATVVDSCSKTSHDAYEQCVNGTAGLVEWETKIFKNNTCALCNGVTAACLVDT